MFVSNIAGTLIRVEEDPTSRFRFEVWFDYTRKVMNLIHEGAMLAAPNFASSSTEQHLSILEVVSVLPMHYALGNNTTGYPGFVVEAARSAVNDWEEQESESTEHVTKIRCITIPTNLEIVQPVRAPAASSLVLQEESNLPMIGCSVRLLDTEATQHIVNNGLGPEDNTLIAGQLIRDRNVDIQARIDDLLRTHFGVFGFTGAGKSNLLSTLLSKVLSNNHEPVKILLFDLMGEYTALLVDQLAHLSDAAIIALGEKTLPGPVVDYLAKPADEKLRSTVKSVLDTTLLPRALASIKREFGFGFRQILLQNKIRVYREQAPTIDRMLDDNRQLLFKGTLNKSSMNVLNKWFTEKRQAYEGKPITSAIVKDLVQSLGDLQGITGNATKSLGNFRSEIQHQGTEYANRRELPKEATISILELVQQLNDRTQPGLFIIQAADPDTLRKFASSLGNKVFEERRKAGQTMPLVSFVFDEADEFISQQTAGTYGQSAKIAMTLARRGRKFGLGIGIATQRIRYLDTNIMAQPHTYFVSKLPRATDREAVAQAFGASEEVFRQTFKFKKGNWLLMSYDATGIEAIPVPIHCEDANVRITKFLKKARQDYESGPAHS